MGKIDEITHEDAKSPDDILEQCMGKYSCVVVTGIDEKGALFMRTSVDSVPMMHWMMNRSVFELGLWEKTATGINLNPEEVEESIASEGVDPVETSE